MLVAITTAPHQATCLSPQPQYHLFYWLPLLPTLAIAVRMASCFIPCDSPQHLVSPGKDSTYSHTRLCSDSSECFHILPRSLM